MTAIRTAIYGAIVCCAASLSPAFAQDSATVDVDAVLVEAPSQFAFTSGSPLSFGTIALPDHDPVNGNTCIYAIRDVQADGSATLLVRDADDGQIAVGAVSSNGCFGAGDVVPAHFQFSCTAANVTFAFSNVSPPSPPEVLHNVTVGQPEPGIDFVVVAKNGLLVSAGGDVVNAGDPWGVDCGQFGDGAYDLYVGALAFFTTRDPLSGLTLSDLSLGTLTVDAIY